jgi:hypothetical protein
MTPRRFLATVLAGAAAFALFAPATACGPTPHVKPIGSRVAPLPPPTPPPPPGAQHALPPSLPGGWRLSGGPADYTAATAVTALGEEAGRFRGLKSYATAEYANMGQRVISAEAFVLGSPESAAGALKIGRPADAKAITGNDLDEAFSAGLRAEARKGTLLVRVRWFEDKDESLADAAVEALRDVLAAGVAAGLSAPPVAPAPASATATPATVAPVAPAPALPAH